MLKGETTVLDQIIAKCKEEIEWAQACIDEMNLNPHNYKDNDKVWLPCWLQAHSEILSLLTNDRD